MRGLKKLTAGDTTTAGYTVYPKHKSIWLRAVHELAVLSTLLSHPDPQNSRERTPAETKDLNWSDKTVEKTTHMSTTLKMLAVGFYPVESESM
jgi:hypothetical protein